MAPEMQSMNKKIAVLGTGANGSCAAADLIKDGFDVTMIDQWPEHVEVMRRNGLHISLADEELHVPVRGLHLCDVATLHETIDIVFLLTKAYDARWPVELIKPHLKDDGLMIALQNAMTAGPVAPAAHRRFPEHPWPRGPTMGWRLHSGSDRLRATSRQAEARTRPRSSPSGRAYGRALG
jgi:predicted O-methyltransferase YrrM